MPNLIYFNTWGDILDFKIYVFEIKLTKVLLLILIVLCFLIMFFMLRSFIKNKQITQKQKEIALQIKSYHKKKLLSLTGNEFIKAFVKYIENFHLNYNYKSIEDIFKNLPIEKDFIKKVFYKDMEIDENQVSKLKEIVKKL